MTLPNNRKIFDMGRNISQERIAFVYRGNLPRDAAEERLLDEYMQAISARVNDELDRRLTNLLAFGTTHPETMASIATSEEEQGLTWERVPHMHDEVQARHEDNAPPVTAGASTPEVDYTKELVDVPTIDEMWAKMEKLGILRDV